MKKENINMVKQAIIDEYEIDDELATYVAEVALEGVGKSLLTSLIALTDKLMKSKEENE